MASLLTSVLAAGSLKENAGIMVMKKAMDAKQQNADSMLQILSSVTVNPPHLGNKVDTRA